MLGSKWSQLGKKRMKTTSVYCTQVLIIQKCSCDRTQVLIIQNCSCDRHTNIFCHVILCNCISVISMKKFQWETVI